MGNSSNGAIGAQFKATGNYSSNPNYLQMMQSIYGNQAQNVTQPSIPNFVGGAYGLAPREMGGARTVSGIRANPYSTSGNIGHARSIPGVSYGGAEQNPWALLAQRLMAGNQYKTNPSSMPYWMSLLQGR